MEKARSFEAPRGQARTKDEYPLISDAWLRRVIGILWLIDGLLQLQPAMFTMNMVNGVMAPAAEGQPAPIAASLSWIIAFTTHNLTLVNSGIALIQLAIGILLISGRWVKQAAIASVIWAVMVWYAGEGFSMLLTGQASALSGAPGSVLFYALFAFWFIRENKSSVIPRQWFRLALAAFWCFAALLQLQPSWWASKQISKEISSLYSPGTLSGIVVDPSLHWLAGMTSGSEFPLNFALVVVFLIVGIGLFAAKPHQLRPWLVVSIVLSLAIWWFNQALGMFLTGMATDPNSGLLLVLLALACWNSSPSLVESRTRRLDPAQAPAH